MDGLQSDERHLDHDRVRQHTASTVNARIDEQTRAGVDASIQQGPLAVQRRLSELDEEWDIDRALMVNFAVLGGAAFAVGLSRFAKPRLFSARPKGFLYLFGAQLGFLLMHGVVGWCPPAPVFRRLGFRTQREIEAERAELKAALTLLEP